MRFLLPSHLPLLPFSFSALFDRVTEWLTTRQAMLAAGPTLQDAIDAMQ